MGTADAMLLIAGALFAAYVLGAIVWVICWSVISRFLEKRPRLSSWLGWWRLLRWIAAVFPEHGERVHDILVKALHGGVLPRRERFGWKRVARQTLCFTAAGLLILAAFYLRGAYKRSVQWYEVEPPLDFAGAVAGDARADLSASIRYWTVTGVFWTKDACLQHIRLEAETDANFPFDRTRSSVSRPDRKYISSRSENTSV